MLKEKQAYCFKATLQHEMQLSTFDVRFMVMADDRFKARAMLDEWLKNPEQTGYKFKCCVGVAEEANHWVIVDEGMT